MTGHRFDRECRCGCGLSIDHRAEQARFYDRNHAKRYERALQRFEDEREREQNAVREPVAVSRICGCGSNATYLDPETELVCVSCGKPKQPPAASVNAYDRRLRETQAAMRNKDRFQARKRGTELVFRSGFGLRTRSLSLETPLPRAVRQCGSCGALLRKGRPGSLCSTCVREGAER